MARARSILLEEKGTALRKSMGATELTPGCLRWPDSVGPHDRGQADTHMELAEIILDESGYTEMWQNDKTPEAPGRLENLKELVKALEQFENLQGFLEHVSLIMDNDSQDGREGLDHDAARRQGAGVSRRLPAGMGGRAFSLATLDG